MSKAWGKQFPYPALATLLLQKIGTAHPKYDSFSSRRCYRLATGIGPALQTCREQQLSLHLKL